MGHPNSGRDKLAFLFSFFFLEEMELKLLFWTLVWLQFFCCSDLLLAHTASTPRSSTASDPSVSLNNVLVCYKSTFKKKTFFMHLKWFSPHAYCVLYFFVLLILLRIHTENVLSIVGAKRCVWSKRNNFAFLRLLPILFNKSVGPYTLT